MSRFSRISALIGACVVAGALFACSHDSAYEDRLGSVALELSAESNGVRYRLRDATFEIQGPTQTSLSTELDPDATSLQVELPPGAYLVTLLDGWFLERETEAGFETVEAELISDNPLDVVVAANSAVNANFRFVVPGEEEPVDFSDLFGFEDPSLWSSSASLSPSDVRVQGQRSLAVQGGGFHFVDSIPLEGLELTGSSVRVALRLPSEQPNPFWFGELQLVLDAPSVGLDDAFVGAAALTGLPTGKFVDLEFTLGPDILTALNQEFDDLVIRLGLNVPGDATGIYRFDNLRFAGSSACDESCEGTCVDGNCVIPCPEGLGDCDGNASNGCETPVVADSSNCGACGVQCGPGTVCQASECVPSFDCGPTEADCDGDPANLCETDVSSDVDHCGGCGITCGAGQACVDGACLAGELEATLLVTTDWGAGYCANLILTNVGTLATNSWSVVLDTLGASISPWNANFTGTAGVVMLTPLGWNAQIAPGTSNQSVGFCATRSGGGAVAAIVSVQP